MNPDKGKSSVYITLMNSGQFYGKTGNTNCSIVFLPQISQIAQILCLHNFQILINPLRGFNHSKFLAGFTSAQLAKSAAEPGNMITFAGCGLMD